MGGRFVEGRSVEGRLVGRTFCSGGRFVEGRFVLVPNDLDEHICSLIGSYSTYPLYSQKEEGTVGKENYQ